MAQEDDRCVTRLAEEKMLPMPIAIECKTCLFWPAVMHHP